MRTGRSTLLLRLFSLAFIILAAILLVYQLIQYSVSRANYPLDMTIGNVPVGGLDPNAASQRLLEVFAVPVEIHYGDSIIDLDPSIVGFQLNIDSMLAAADLQRTGLSFWGGFWDYLWGRTSPTTQIPLVASYSEERLRIYLTDDISARYDQQPVPAQPIPGTFNFSPGIPGQTLDVNRAVALIDGALTSSTQRVVTLSSQATAAGRPSLETLKILLKQLIDQNGFQGLTDINLVDLQTSEELHFGYQQGTEVSVTPTDVAFTASSTIKIPIMITIFYKFNGQIDEQLNENLIDMISLSNNIASDSLMKKLDEIRGPLVVTETIKQLGLQNTFLAGFFCTPENPCPMLQRFDTPANQRVDVNTDPDTYSQTTPVDMGLLLTDIYNCAQTGGGTLLAVFPGQFSQSACQQMIQYLQEDKLGSLIQAGVPEGTIVAHKHGWDENLTQYSDAGIVYTPGGNYVLTIYVFNPGGGNWAVVSPMYAELSRAIYNFFNLPTQ